MHKPKSMRGLTLINIVHICVLSFILLPRKLSVHCIQNHVLFRSFWKNSGRKRKKTLNFFELHFATVFTFTAMSLTVWNKNTITHRKSENCLREDSHVLMIYIHNRWNLEKLIKKLQMNFATISIHFPSKAKSCFWNYHEYLVRNMGKDSEMTKRLGKRDIELLLIPIYWLILPLARTRSQTLAWEWLFNTMLGCNLFNCVISINYFKQCSWFWNLFQGCRYWLPYKRAIFNFTGIDWNFKNNAVSNTSC